MVGWGVGGGGGREGVAGWGGDGHCNDGVDSKKVRKINHLPTWRKEIRAGFWFFSPSPLQGRNGPRRLNLWLNFCKYALAGRKERKAGGLQCKLSPPTPRYPPPPLRARVISKGWAAAKPDLPQPRRQKEHRISPPPCLCKLQQPCQPPAFV